MPRVVVDPLDIARLYDAPVYAILTRSSYFRGERESAALVEIDDGRSYKEKSSWARDKGALGGEKDFESVSSEE